jgi:hypothetical protein
VTCDGGPVSAMVKLMREGATAAASAIFSISSR